MKTAVSSENKKVPQHKIAIYSSPRSVDKREIHDDIEAELYGSLNPMQHH